MQSQVIGRCTSIFIFQPSPLAYKVSPAHQPELHPNPMSSACPPQQSEEQPHPRISHPAAATARISPSRAARISSGLPPPSPSPASSIPAVCISRLHHGRPRAPRPRIAAAVKPSRPSSRPPPPLRARRSRHIRHPHPARRRSRRPHRSLPKLVLAPLFPSIPVRSSLPFLSPR